MSSRPHTIIFDRAIYEVWPDCVRTRLPAGLQVVAAPQDTAEYHARALSLGYEDAASLNRWHDFIHLLVAQLLGNGSRFACSPTLEAVALGREHELPAWLSRGEESLALAFARYVNTGEPNEWLAPLVIGGHDLGNLRARALELRALVEQTR